MTCAVCHREIPYCDPDYCLNCGAAMCSACATREEFCDQCEKPAVYPDATLNDEESERYADRLWSEGLRNVSSLRDQILKARAVK